MRHSKALALRFTTHGSCQHCRLVAVQHTACCTYLCNDTALLQRHSLVIADQASVWHDAGMRTMPSAASVMRWYTGVPKQQEEEAAASQDPTNTKSWREGCSILVRRLSSMYSAVASHHRHACTHAGLDVRMQVSMFAKGGVLFVVAYACIYARHASDGAVLMHERCPVMCRSHPSHLSLICHQSSVRHDLALPLLYPTSRAATTCYSTRHMPCVAKIKQHAALYSRHLTPF